MAVTTWNTAPDYDNWGSDTSWSCNDWILWHQYLKPKFGQAKANFIWNYAFSQSGTLSKNLDCRTFNSTFREYVKANGNECVFQNDNEGFSPMHWVNFKFLFNIYRFYESLHI